MAGLGHFGFGFAAKSFTPRIPLLVLLLASELIDILWGLFYFTGIDHNSAGLNLYPWSHSLLMSAIWSVLAALAGVLFYHDRRAGITIGLLVFSHWVIDFITHPMGAIFGGKPLLADLPLFFNGSSNLGLGLYNHSFTTAIVSDITMLIIGVVIYLRYRKRLISQPLNRE